MRSIEEEQNNVHLFQLYNRLKRVIYRATSIDFLLKNVCEIISEHVIYKQAWLFYLDEDNELKFYSSLKNSSPTTLSAETPCYKISSSAKDIVIIRNKDEFCKSCAYKSDDDSILFSIPLRFKGDYYGTFSVNVEREFADLKEHQIQFKEIVEDISYAIYNFKLEQNFKYKQNELLLLQDRPQSLLAALPNAVIYTDLEMNMTFISDRAKQIFQDLIPNNGRVISGKFKLDKIFPEHEYNKLVNIFNQLISQKIDFAETVCHLVINANIYKTIKIASKVFLDSNTKVSGVVSTIQDYSLIEKNESELTFYEKKFSTIFNEAPAGISIIDAQGTIIDVNEMECKILGYSQQELVGKPMQDFFIDEFKKDFNSHFKELLIKGTKELDIEMLNKDGRKIIVRKSGKAIYDDNGNLNTIVVHSRDYTEILEVNNRIKTLSKAINQSPSIFTITVIEGNITYVNQQFEKVTGYSFKEINGKNSRILKSDLYDKNYYKSLWDTIKNGKEWNGRFHNVKKNGDKYWEYAMISPFVEDNGQVSGYIKSGEDITSNIEIHKKLKESNERYQKVFEFVPIPIVILKNGVIIEANQAALDFSKIKTKKEFINSEIKNYIESNYYDFVISTLDSVTKSGKIAPAFEIKFYNGIGELRDVSVVVSPFTFNGEESIMAAFMDITDKNNWLAKLKESESKFKSIFDTNPNSVTLTSLEDGTFIDVNQGFCRISGYEKGEIIGKTSKEIGIFVDFNERKKLTDEVKKNGLVDGLEMQFRVKSGAIVVVILSARVINIRKENVLLMVAQDISSRKIMEKELIDARLKAEENDKLKSAFLANMSHEIRNPMNAIIGFSDLLKDEGLTHEEQINYIDIIQSKSDQLMLLINDIIDISKIESGLLEVECDDVNVFGFLKKLEKDFATLVHIRSKGKVKFAVKNKNSKDLFIWADSHRLDQVFYNLISNAIKFTHKGDIVVSFEEQENSILFKVSDTGIGIPENKTNLIFERFSQVNHVKDELIGGTGLGLSITKSLLTLMQSSISVDSTLGMGSSFYVNIPKSKNINIITKSTEIKNDNNNLVLNGKEIAIVEDDIASMAYIVTLLKSTKASYSTFTSTDELKEQFGHLKQLDLVIVETKFISFKLMECFNEIKSKFPNSKVIGISADILQNTELDKIKLRLDGFISKPFTKIDIFKAIDKVLS